MVLHDGTDTLHTTTSPGQYRGGEGIGWGQATVQDALRGSVRVSAAVPRSLRRARGAWRTATQLLSINEDKVVQTRHGSRGDVTRTWRAIALTIARWPGGAAVLLRRILECIGEHAELDDVIHRGNARVSQRIYDLAGDALLQWQRYAAHPTAVSKVAVTAGHRRRRCGLTARWRTCNARVRAMTRHAASVSSFTSFDTSHWFTRVQDGSHATPMV